MDFCNCRSSSRLCVGNSFFSYTSDNLSSEAKLFSDDTSLLFVVYDEKVTAEKLDTDFSNYNWAYQ